MITPLYNSFIKSISH